MKHLCFVVLSLAVGTGFAQRAQPEFPKSVLLVSLNAERQVVAIDPLTLRVLASFPSPSGPHEITFSSRNHLAYIADSGAGPGAPPGESITVVDLKTRSPKATFRACAQAHDTRVSRNGQLLWVACAPAKAVLEMDARTGVVRKSWDVRRDGGWFVEITPDGRKLYVPHLEGKAVSVIDRTTGDVRTPISGTTQFGIAISPNGKEVWASDAEENKLSIIDTTHDRVVATVRLGDAVPGRMSFARLRFTPDGRQVVVVNRSQFIVVDVQSRSIVWRLEMPHDGKVVTVNSESRRAFVTHPSNDRVSVMDLRNRRVETTFVVGKQPDGIAWAQFARNESRR